MKKWSDGMGVLEIDSEIIELGRMLIDLKRNALRRGNWRPLPDRADVSLGFAFWLPGMPRKFQISGIDCTVIDSIPGCTARMGTSDGGFVEMSIDL